jgi:putative ABC transport system ATP-binding protein
MIEFTDVYKIYHMGQTDVHALDGVTMTINEGEFVAIVGQSGSGKSTAMNIIGCLDVPTSGTYRLNGIDVSTMDDDQQAVIRNKLLGFIFQQYNLIPTLNVLENVELPLLYGGLSASERRATALHALEQVGLADKAKNRPAQLSGGQQQRASIARALAGNPAVILADEPTGALDSRTGREVIAFLRRLNKQGHTIVLITHDNSIAVKAQRIIRLQDGRIIYDGHANDPLAVVQPPEDRELDLGSDLFEEDEREELRL